MNSGALNAVGRSGIEVSEVVGEHVRIQDGAPPEELTGGFGHACVEADLFGLGGDHPDLSADDLQRLVPAKPELFGRLSLSIAVGGERRDRHALLVVEQVAAGVLGVGVADQAKSARRAGCYFSSCTALTVGQQPRRLP